MKDPTYPLVPILNVLAACLLSFTLISIVLREARSNRGVVMLCVWVLVQDTLMAIQSIVWRESWRIEMPVFCDISSHLWIGLTIGIPACSFVITRRLWLAVRANPGSGRKKTHDGILVDYLLGLGLPLLSMSVYYLVQAARFQVIENYGPSTYIYPCWVAVILLQSWPIIFPILSTSLYGWRIVTRLHRHRRTTRELKLLQYNGDQVQRTHYRRLFTLACIDTVLVLPLGIVPFVPGVPTPAMSTSGDEFWPGWNTIKEWWAPQAVSSDEWRISVAWSVNIYWNQLFGVLLSVVIFLLFGFTRDARERCGTALSRARNFGTLMPKSRRSSSRISLPTALPIARIRRADSLSMVNISKSMGDETNLVDIEVRWSTYNSTTM
ncbi:unnamed protein product [Peniophora sp. CBMAI 1063]|nr:unnamed protein product [Peniophora sp. CBMAI 1063]